MSNGTSKRTNQALRSQLRTAQQIKASGMRLRRGRWRSPSKRKEA